MSDTIVSAGVPEVTLGQTIPQPQSIPPTFSGKWEDFGKDMAAIEAETKEPAQPEPSQPPQAAATPSVEAPIQAPQQPAAPKTPVEVPDKFKNPEGTLDPEKILKSYAEAEKRLKQLQNASRAPQPIVQPQPQQPAQQPTAHPLTPFEAQVAQDLIDEAAAQGVQMPQGYAIAQARIQVRLYEAKHQADTAATFSKVSQFEQILENQARRDELMNLAKVAPWVATPQGITELERVMGENPDLLDKPDKWTRATKILLGERALSQVPVGQVNMPIPKGVQQTVPPLPVTPSQPVTSPIPLNTPQQIEAYVKTLTPQQEAEFWRKSGLKWEDPRQQFKGI